jgi:hypothetical protein
VLFELCSYLREGLADEFLSFLVFSTLPDACFTFSLTCAFVSELAGLARSEGPAFCDFCSRVGAVVEICLFDLFSTLAGLEAELVLSVVL